VDYLKLAPLLAALAVASLLLVSPYASADQGEPASGGVLGDADCSGRANAIDSALVLQYHARLLEHLACSALGDVDSDADLDSIDAFLMLKVHAGLFFLGLPPPPAKDAIDAARQATADEENIPLVQVVLASITREIWPDGCLGLGDKGEACTEALVDGYAITMKGWSVPLPAPPAPSPTSIPAAWYTWRTDLDGTRIRLDSIAVP